MKPETRNNFDSQPQPATAREQHRRPVKFETGIDVRAIERAIDQAVCIDAPTFDISEIAHAAGRLLELATAELATAALNGGRS